MYARFAESKIIEALADTPVVAVVGPRQAGKTTLVRKLAGSGREYLTLDDPPTVAAARRDPVGFVRRLDVAAIDEVQRAPELMLPIKQSVDEDRRPGRFLLTGSAHILTVPRMKESLAGRMQIVTLYPLSQGEILGRQAPRFLEQAFSARIGQSDQTALVGDTLISVILAGGYPEVLERASLSRRREWCRAYLDAIVERDIREIADVAKLGEMARLLHVLAQFAGRLINFAEIGGQLGLDRKTAERYLTILEQLFLVRRLQPWFRNELKRLVKTPKLHFIDSGLLAALRGESREKVGVDRTFLGPLFESYVYSELLKQASWADQRLSFFHYRDKDQVEVDVVIEDEAGDIVGIEVKAAATVGAADFRGLERLASAAGKSFRFGAVLYDGARTLPFGDRLYAAPLSALWS